MVIAAGALLLLLSSVAIYAILVGPSKQPYRDALAQYRNVYNANVTFTNAGSALNATSASEEQFSDNIETVETAMNSLKVETEALGKMEVLSTGEGRELYDTFNVKMTDYLAYNEKVIASIETLRPVLLACSQQMNAISENEASAAALRTCAADMEKVENVPDSDYKQLIASFKESYSAAAETIAKMAALDAPDTDDKAAYDTLAQERDAIIEDLNEASAELSQDLQQSRQTVDITEAAMALDTYLSKKSSIF